MASRMLVCNLFNGNIIEELSFDSFQYTRTKNVPGGWQATLNHRDERLARQPGLLEPWTRAIYLDYDGVILFGGILQPKHLDPEGTAGSTLGLGGEGFFSYYRERRRSIRGNEGMAYATKPGPDEVRFDQVDQFLIVKDLLDHAAAWVAAGGSQGNVGYDGIRFHGPLPAVIGPPSYPAGLTGRLRDRSYFTYEFKEIGEAIEQGSAVIDGFEFSESYGWSGEGGSVDRFFDLWYPQKGQYGQSIDPQFSLRKLEQDIDAGALATRVIALGSGDSDAKFTAYSFDFTREYPTGAYPAMEKVTDYNDVIIQSTLQAHADYDLAVAKIVKQTLNVEFMPTGEFRPGSIDWGDFYHVAVDDVELQIDDDYRVESLTVQVGREGEVTVTGTLALAAQSAPREM
jgi:hypothetical protein